MVPRTDRAVTKVEWPRHLWGPRKIVYHPPTPVHGTSLGAPKRSCIQALLIPSPTVMWI